MYALASLSAVSFVQFSLSKLVRFPAFVFDTNLLRLFFMDARRLRKLFSCTKIEDLLLAAFSTQLRNIILSIKNQTTLLNTTMPSVTAISPRLATFSLHSSFRGSNKQAILSVPTIFAPIRNAK